MCVDECLVVLGGRTWSVMLSIVGRIVSRESLSIEE